MNEPQNLIEMFAAAARPLEKRASLTFKANNQVLFEIEVNCQGDQGFSNDVLGIVEQAVNAAVTKLK